MRLKAERESDEKQKAPWATRHGRSRVIFMVIVDRAGYWLRERTVELSDSEGKVSLQRGASLLRIKGGGRRI